jgi:hypothetical protein
MPSLYILIPGCRDFCLSPSLNNSPGQFFAADLRHYHFRRQLGDDAHKKGDDLKVEYLWHGDVPKPLKKLG